MYSATRRQGNTPTARKRICMQNTDLCACMHRRFPADIKKGKVATEFAPVASC